MRSMRSITSIMLLGMSLGGISACGSTVLSSTPVSKSGDGWAVTLEQAKEGPDEYVGEGGVLVEAGDGQKLVWALVTVRNDGPQEQTFEYEKCFLEGPGEARRPSVIDKHMPELNTAADRAESFNPGEARTRMIVYTFPSDKRPTTLKCESAALPIKAVK